VTEGRRDLDGCMPYVIKAQGWGGFSKGGSRDLDGQAERRRNVRRRERGGSGAGRSGAGVWGRMGRETLVLLGSARRSVGVGGRERGGREGGGGQRQIVNRRMIRGVDSINYSTMEMWN
jgi:hypothetical protein